MVAKQEPRRDEMRRATFHVATWGKSAVMSSPKVDRVGDSIVQAGWDLAEFTKNPVMLYEHCSDEPVGVWSNVRLDGGNLTGDPVWHPADINPFADRLRKLYEAGWLKAFSVGFRPLEWEPMPDGRGFLIKRAELVECSCVTIPANSDALMKAAPGARIAAVFGAGPTAEVRKQGRNDAAIAAWSKTTAARVETKTMDPSELIAAIAANPDALAALRKALGSVRDEATPPSQPEGNAPADGADDGEDDELAVAIAETEATAAEIEALAAEIECEAGTQEEA